MTADTPKTTPKPLEKCDCTSYHCRWYQAEIRSALEWARWNSYLRMKKCPRLKKWKVVRDTYEEAFKAVFE